VTVQRSGVNNVAKSRGGGTRFVDALPEDGERRLMLAVLIDAIRGLTAHRPAVPQFRSQRAWLRDRAWIQAEDKSAPFSFSNICDALGIDAGYVRRCVLRPPEMQRPIRVRRYPERVKESWSRLQRDSTQRAKSIPRGTDGPKRLPPQVLKQGVG
jgi:hypothetical protein